MDGTGSIIFATMFKLINVKFLSKKINHDVKPYPFTTKRYWTLQFLEVSSFLTLF